MRKAPCYGCDRRNADCRSVCRLYLEWRKEKDEENEEIRKRKEFDYLSTLTNNGYY